MSGRPPQGYGASDSRRAANDADVALVTDVERGAGRSSLAGDAADTNPVPWAIVPT
jgi:hypothetical protein